MTTSPYAQPDSSMIATTMPFELDQVSVMSAPSPANEAPAQPFDTSTQPAVVHIGAASMVARPATSTQAIVSLVFGILSLWPLPIAGSIVAIVIGYFARREISSANGQLGGSRQALIGIALGTAMLVLWMLVACVALAIRLSYR